MLSLFKRARRTGSQLGVFVTADGVAAAQVGASPPGRKPRLERCVYETYAARRAATTTRSRASWASCRAGAARR